MFNDTPPQRAFWSNTPPLGAEIIRKQVVEKYFKSWFLRHFWGLCPKTAVERAFWSNTPPLSLIHI